MFNITSKLKTVLIALVATALLMPILTSYAAEKAYKHVMIHTNYGDIEVELNHDKAPMTVKNFLKYVEQGFYENTIFHRVIDGFMIQGGGLEKSMATKQTLAPIQNEADNGLNNERGTISMARTMEPHSASSQFFINLADNDFLDFKSKSQRGWGYCVFGRVTKGHEIVEKIAKVKTSSKGMHQNVPVENVVIERVEVLSD